MPNDKPSLDTLAAQLLTGGDLSESDKRRIAACVSRVARNIESAQDVPDDGDNPTAPAETLEEAVRRIDKCFALAGEWIGVQDWQRIKSALSHALPIAWIHRDAAILTQGKLHDPSLDHEYIPVYAAPQAPALTGTAFTGQPAEAAPSTTRRISADGWQPINTAPMSDDLIWLRRGDSIEGPRAWDAYDPDRYHWWAPCEPPSSAASATAPNALLREFYEQVNAIHGDDACDARTLERVRAELNNSPDGTAKA